MSRLFETVEDFVAYVAKATRDFANTELREHLVDTMGYFAFKYVYAVYEPSMYQRKYTLMDKGYYKQRITESGFRTSNSELDVYTYSISPHVKSVVEGVPYDYAFEYNGVPRPYIDYANEMLDTPLGMNVLRSRLVSFYKKYYGLDAK